MKRPKDMTAEELRAIPLLAEGEAVLATYWLPDDLLAATIDGEPYRLVQAKAGWRREGLRL